MVTKLCEDDERFKPCKDLFANIILGRLINDGVECWVAGGCLRDYFSGKRRKFSDIDVFFPNIDEYNKAVEILKEKTGTDGKTIYDEKDSIVLLDGVPEITLEMKPRYTTFKYNGNYIQLIAFKFFESPKETIENFDFTVCCCAIDLDYIYYHDNFFMDLASKKLIINNLPYPLSTLRRLQKYIQNGFTICSGGLYSIADAIRGLPDSEMEEQNIYWYID